MINETESTFDSTTRDGSRQQPTEQEIAALAQRIYEEEGCPEGRAEMHWHEAERRLRQSEGESSRT